MHRYSFYRRTGLAQLKAVLLLVVFLAAGTSLPSLDALAYHQDSAEPRRSQPHVEPAGGCLNHSDHCGLSRGAPGSGSGLTPNHELRLDTTGASPHPLLQALAPARADHHGIPQPRAPPVRLA